MQGVVPGGGVEVSCLRAHSLAGSGRGARSVLRWTFGRVARVRAVVRESSAETPALGVRVTIVLAARAVSSRLYHIALAPSTWHPSVIGSIMSTLHIYYPSIVIIASIPHTVVTWQVRCSIRRIIALLICFAHNNYWIFGMIGLLGPFIYFSLFTGSR